MTKEQLPVPANKDALVAPEAPIEDSYPVPDPLPHTGERVLFVLRPLGAGKEFYPKVRPATVTEAWDGLEKHPTGKVRGHDGKERPAPAGVVNLEIHLDACSRKDLNHGHNAYEPHVLYDPVRKRHGTWHRRGD